MILLFPDQSTLQLALTSGLLPGEAVAAPCEFATHEDGRVWVKCDGELEISRRESLKRLGVKFRKSTRGASSALQSVGCWPQILTLEKTPTDQDLGERTPVLFELPQSAKLADVVSEMLRLGNDRQSFRQHQTPAGVRTLLQVNGPPYYTLLRAIDHTDGPAAPRAYVEQQPRVWVEVGYTHPLAEQIQPAPGTFLLLSSPREWTLIEEGKFHDIYEALRFTIPGQPIRWNAGELKERLKVRLRLVRGGSDDPAELWVLSEAGISQLEELVYGSDDRLVSRLAFAVGTSDNSQNARTVVVKVRPGKEAPPVLVLEGVACRSYLRIPNLFLPVGYRLHPPLRRDAVKQLLAADPNLDTWLLPQADGQFVPQSLPDNAFRPLSDWVDYVLDSERDALATWMGAVQFDFESFVCPDEGPDRTTKSQIKRRETAAKAGKEVPPKSPQAATPTKHASAKKPSASPQPAKRRTPRTAEAAAVQPDELRWKLQALESQFREMSEPADAPARLALWRELAETHMALGGQQTAEGAVCYVHGLWEQHDIPQDWVWDWFAAEADGRDIKPMTGEQFLTALKADKPTPAQLNQITVHLMGAAFGSDVPPVQAQKHLGRVQQRLETYETFLPLRTAWLAWLACVKLAHNDVLLLARVRDRMLERLYHYGLSPELDLPGFLRSSGRRTGERYRKIQGDLLALRQRVQAWIKRELQSTSSTGKGQTAAYADLILAYGYSRIGLAEECQHLLEDAREQLSRPNVKHAVHDWLWEAFRYRITQSLQGKSRAGSLPDELTKVLIEKRMEPGLVFIIDSLRGKSRILQPYEKIGGHTRFLAARGDNSTNLASEVEHLSDIDHRVELATKIHELLDQYGGQQPLADSQPRAPLSRDPTSAAPSNYQVLLTVLLQFAPRLGESHANELLSEVSGTLELLPDPRRQALLLDKSLFVAAHFGHSAQVRQLVEQLDALFESAGSPETARVFGELLGQSFRGLRKLGMRGEISKLLEHIDQLLAAGRFEPSNQEPNTGKKPKSIKPSKGREDQLLAQRMDSMLLRLNLAAGWFFFGNAERANAIIEEVARFLYQERGLQPHLRRLLTRQYAAVLEHAPIAVAIPRLNEIFEKLTNISKGIGAGIQDQYYAQEPLEVIEAVVLALVSDEFTLDPQSRKLMDEYEFSIRRRIHHDLDLARREGGL